MTKSHLEETLLFHIQSLALPEPEREYRFHPTRRWRFDFAWPLLKIAAEAEGGTYTRGRHTRGSGFEKDCEKYNAAAELGWKVFRYPKTPILDGRAIDQLQRILTPQEES